jgi:hypothetical protein
MDVQNGDALSVDFNGEIVRIVRNLEREFAQLVCTVLGFKRTAP